ncbi:flagellar assembly protein FliW [Paenibacillus illinoisensis]|uniref:flagellar assembly protein FliW n=1 Tax=Paenibacillus illinoisensis TaxID=59845 RepID=UPI0034B277EA
MWGEIDVREDNVYHFAKGVPGFDEETEFALIPWEDTPFIYLQSTKQPELSFLLVSPFVFAPDYSFELPEADRDELEISEDVAIYSIVTIQTEVSKSTMNLLAPVVLNPSKRIGKQVVLHQSSYATRHQIWPARDTNSVKGGV